MTTYIVTIPAPAGWISSNDRGHWAPRARLTRTWRAAARLQAKTAKVPQLSRVRIVAEVQRPDRRRADAANRYPTIKAAIDGLVDAGVIADDDDKHVDDLVIRRGATVARRLGQLTLHITEVDDDD
ncbi:RusA family crossover junction endodeoxyribonuclease [Salininema proteolyticum]|uniref:Uncharacterized protein n=1 Tax=Salininema proteolyticum TaxID=1607685 RepID=A0ABV8TSZ6_9ACTN